MNETSALRTGGRALAASVSIVVLAVVGAAAAAPRLLPPSNPAPPSASAQVPEQASRIAPLRGESLISADIQAMPEGKVNKEIWTAQFPETEKFPRSEESLRDTSIVADSTFGKAVRITLPEGRWSGDGKGDHGLINFPKLDKDVTEATMDYYIRFDPNYDWGWGGKLPGLMGVAPGVNPLEPHKGSRTTEGWSARRMWLTNQSYGQVPAEMSNNLVTYFYWPGRNSKIAENVWWQHDDDSRVALDRGEWHHVRQYVKLNTPGHADGTLREWVDGELVLNRTDAEFRVKSSVKVSNISWNVFRGGNSADWRGSRDSWVEFADVKVVEGPPA